MTFPRTDLDKAMTAAFSAVCDLRHAYGRELPAGLDGITASFLQAVTDIVSPYKVEELDARIAEMDKRWPDREHYYVRWGPTVTWCDRPRKPADGSQNASNSQHAGKGQPTTQPAPSQPAPSRTGRRRQ